MTLKGVVMQNGRQKETSITLLQRRPPDLQTEPVATGVTETMPALLALRTEVQWGIV